MIPRPEFSSLSCLASAKVRRTLVLSESQVTNHESRATSHESQVTSL
jgi:hypothetical protein